MTVMSERVIVKLGGSLLSPYETSENLLKQGRIPFDEEYVATLLQIVKETNKKFIFIVGGGYLNRWILKGITGDKNFAQAPVTDRHHIGIASGIINSMLFHSMAVTLLGEEMVYSEVLKYSDYDKLAEYKSAMDQSKVVVASGRKPGFSHDVVALYFATLFGTNQILTLKNIDGIYTADPHVDTMAVKKKVLTWAEYRSIIKVSEHQPGASFPIDAIAAQYAESLKIGFTVLDGRDWNAVTEAFQTRLTASGSVISPA